MRLRRQLDKVVKTRSLHRAARAKVPFPIVALVGYTNAGKSTLFNRLTGAEVMAKDMLFATLDPTMRSIKLSSGVDIILSDTVGFISDLPTELVAAFRATLEEVLEADIILHVRDISHPATEEQSEDVEKILESLRISEDTPQLEVWNKVDLIDADDRDALDKIAERNDHILTISAITGQGLDELVNRVLTHLTRDIIEDDVHLPYTNGRARGWLFEQGVVDSETQGEDGSLFHLRWNSKQKAQFKKSFGITHSKE